MPSQFLRRSLIAVAICSMPGAALGQLPPEISGSWSGDPNCSRIAMRHIFADGTFEWTGDGRRYYLGEATYDVEGARLQVTLTRDIDAPFKSPKAPKAGDVLIYQRHGDGWKPLSLRRGAEVEATPPDTQVFRRCT